MCSTAAETFAGSGAAAAETFASEAAAAEGAGGDVKAVRRRALHYYDIVEPAAALEYLELELDRLIEQGLKTAGEDGMKAQGGPVVACTALCTLIKQECEAEVRRDVILSLCCRPQRYKENEIAPKDTSCVPMRW